jgi:hypothetical protein
VGQEANISYIDCNDLATLPLVRIVVTKVTPAVPIGGKGWIDVTICELSNSVLPAFCGIAGAFSRTAL